MTGKWDVPLMVTRGFASVSYLWEAAEHIRGVGKPTNIFYFGDLDSGDIHIDKHVERRLRELAPEAAICFERVAVLPEQVTELGLLTRPTKTSDSRSKGFSGDSVEVDAIPPALLREMARECIERHVDHARLEVLLVAEKSEREFLERFCARGGPR